MLAVIHDAIAPPIIAFKAIFEISFLRLGAMPPMPPIWMPMEAKLANPQSA